MCSYCGCRANTVIGGLSTGHVAIINATGARCGEQNGMLPAAAIALDAAAWARIEACAA